MAPLEASLSVEVEVPGRPLLEPQPVVVGRVLKEFGGFLQDVLLVVVGPVVLGTVALSLVLGLVALELVALGVLLVEADLVLLGRLAQVRRRVLFGGGPGGRGVRGRTGDRTRLDSMAVLGIRRVRSLRCVRVPGIRLVRVIERRVRRQRRLVVLSLDGRLVVALDRSGVRRQVLCGDTLWGGLLRLGQCVLI